MLKYDHVNGYIQKGGMEVHRPLEDAMNEWCMKMVKYNILTFQWE